MNLYSSSRLQVQEYVRARMKKTKEKIADIDDFKSLTEGIKLSQFLDVNLHPDNCKYIDCISPSHLVGEDTALYFINPSKMGAIIFNIM